MPQQVEKPIGAALSEVQHVLKLENKNALLATGILAIEAYDAFTVVLKTACGTLTVGGEQLVVSELSVKSGEVKIGGNIEYLQYAPKKSEKGSFFQRLGR